MAQGSEGDERPTSAMRPLEKPDSTRPTVAMPPLFRDADGGIPDREVAGYVIDGEIGRGAMGIVYAATHPKTKARAAIKVLATDPEMADDPTRAARFLFEARSVSEIGHPNIVDVILVGTLPNGRPYLVMELLEGETLRTRVTRGPLPVLEACSVLHGCAAALAAAHARGLIHRDVKPDNVYLVGGLDDKPPTPKVLDFGLVKLSAKSDQDVLTRSGAIVGTPAYMSPEQVRAKPFDHRTDIYALGIMAYELLTGTLPYKKDNPLDVMIAQVNMPVPSVKAAVPDIPAALAAILERMMAKSADARPTLAQIDHLLTRILDIPHAPELPRPNSEVPKASASGSFTFASESATDANAVALSPDQVPTRASAPIDPESTAILGGADPSLHGSSTELLKMGPSAPPPPPIAYRPPQPYGSPAPQERDARNIATTAVDPLPPPRGEITTRTDLQPLLKQARRASNKRLLVIVFVSLALGALLAAVASYA